MIHKDIHKEEEEDGPSAFATPSQQILLEDMAVERGLHLPDVVSDMGKPYPVHKSDVTDIKERLNREPKKSPEELETEENNQTQRGLINELTRMVEMGQEKAAETWIGDQDLIFQGQLWIKLKELAPHQLDGQG